MQYVSTGKHEWTEEEVRFKFKFMQAAERPGIGIYCVILKETKQVIGEAGVFNSFQKKRKLELGYIIDQAFQKKGLGYELCLGLLQFAFTKLKPKRLVARIYRQNLASIKLAEKCGMQQVLAGCAENGKAFVQFELKRKAWNKQESLYFSQQN